MAKATEMDDKPRTVAKAKLLAQSRVIAQAATLLHDALSDNFLPDEACRSLEAESQEIVKRLAGLKVKVDGLSSASAPQGGSVILAEEKEREGLGSLAKLPPEVRAQVWALLPRQILSRLSALSRAANNDILPILMSHVVLRSKTPSSEASCRAMANVVQRLARRGQLAVKKLEVRGTLSSFSFDMMETMGRTVRQLFIDAPRASPGVEQGFDGLSMPRLEVVRMDLGVQLQSWDWGELLMEEEAPLDLSAFIPAGAGLRHLKLKLSLQGPSDVEEDDRHQFEEAVVDIFVDTSPLRPHTNLRSLTVCSKDFEAGEAGPLLQLVSEEGEAMVQLPALSAFAIHANEDGWKMALSKAQLQAVFDLAPNLTRLYLDTTLPEGFSLPHLPPGLRTLALPYDIREDLPNVVKSGTLTSLSLLYWNTTWSDPELGLTRYQGALRLRRTNVPSLSLEGVPSFLLRHLYIEELATGTSIWSWRVLERLPSMLETLGLPTAAGNAYQRRSGVHEEKAHINRLFLQLPALSLLVIKGHPGGFIRLSEPDKDGYNFHWVHRDYENSKAFNTLFGTLAAYENNWWDDSEDG